MYDDERRAQPDYSNPKPNLPEGWVLLESSNDDTWHCWQLHNEEAQIRIHAYYAMYNQAPSDCFIYSTRSSESGVAGFNFDVEFSSKQWPGAHFTDKQTFLDELFKQTESMIEWVWDAHK